jgi:hypothetical protein
VGSTKGGVLGGVEGAAKGRTQGTRGHLELTMVTERAVLETWLSRSGQSWKISTARVSLWVGSCLVLLFYVSPSTFIPFGLVPSWILLTTSLVLPNLVRCQVCGLCVNTTLAARRVPRFQRRSWMESLHACPVCLDDGRASAPSRARWQKVDAAREGPYWSWSRMAVALVAIVVLLAALYILGEIYRVEGTRFTLNGHPPLTPSKLTKSGTCTGARWVV